MESRSSDEAITREGFRGHSNEATYSGVVSFLRRSYSRDLEHVDLVVTGVPFDCATSNRPGTRFGPRAIREASVLQGYEAPYGWDVDPLTELNIADFGDFGFDYARISEFPRQLTEFIADVIKTGTTVLVLGGDHYITYPILRAHAEAFGPLALLQFDAHSDTWPDPNPERIDHGTMFYHAVHQGLVKPELSVQVGIRTSNPDTLGVKILDARWVHHNGPEQTARRIREIIGNHPVYLTFDIDALDPAFAPGTGTPVWGGLTSAQASVILRDIAGINLVGMDVVEVSPQYDVSGATAVAGAHVATDLICLWATGKKVNGDYG